MGDSSAVELEFENIKAAVSKVRSIASDIGVLKANFSTFSDSVHASDWSTESSCMAFAASYKDALTVYTEVIAGMQADLGNYADALEAASKSYEQSDANASAALTKLGTVDDNGFQQDRQGRTSYDQAGHHGDLTSDAPTRAADTTPDDTSGTTVFPTPSDSGPSTTTSSDATGNASGGSPASSTTTGDR